MGWVAHSSCQPLLKQQGLSQNLQSQPDSRQEVPLQTVSGPLSRCTLKHQLAAAQTTHRWKLACQRTKVIHALTQLQTEGGELGVARELLQACLGDGIQPLEAQLVKTSEPCNRQCEGSGPQQAGAGKQWKWLAMP